MTTSTANSAKRAPKQLPRQPPDPDGPIRGSYVPQACMECRRRKLKCDGDKPCHRCKSRSVDCSYDGGYRGRGDTDTEEIRSLQLQLSQMRHMLTDLQSEMRACRAPEGAVEALGAAPRNSSKHQSPINDICSVAQHDSPIFRGPTSAEYSFRVASGALSFGQTKLGTNMSRNGEVDRLVAGYGSEILAGYSLFTKQFLADPIWSWDSGEVIRLVQVFLDGPGALYPVVEAKQLMEAYETLQAELRLNQVSDIQHDVSASLDMLTSPRTIMLKLVLANASAQESCGINSQVQLVFDSIRSALQRSLWGLPNLLSIVNWLLMCLLHFHLDEELQASRSVAHAARLCLEMGLHRKEYRHKLSGGPSDAALSTILLWCIFVLDRRSSIALGIPFVIQDCDMDFSLITSDNEKRHLNYLVSLSQISGTACRLASRLSDKSLVVAVEDIDQLDYRVLVWLKNLPTDFKFAPADLSGFHHVSKHQRRRIFLNFAMNLRANQVRNLIYRPILFSTRRIITYESHASTAIEIAREALHLLYGLHSETGLLRKHAMFFKYFLLSAFSTLVLMLANGVDTASTLRKDPVFRLSERVKSEFQMALNLFEVISDGSTALRRLAESARSLESVLPRINHNKTNTASTSDSPECKVSDQITGLLSSPMRPREMMSSSGPDLGLDLTSGFSMQLSNELSTLVEPATSSPNISWHDWTQADNQINEFTLEDQLSF